MRVGRPCREIERAGTERCNANAWTTREPSMRGRHEGRRLLMPGQNQLDLRIAERFHDIEVFLTRHAKDAIDALVLQCCDQ